MSRKIFAVCDKDREYVKRFAGYAGKREGNPFSIHAFTDPAALRAYMNSDRTDILLAGTDMVDPELEEKVKKDGGVLLFLSGTPGDSVGNYPVVYKYQSTERILRDVMACYEENHPSTGRRKNIRARMYGVYSPVGRCYKTTFSLALGQMLADRASTLYVNLEDVSGFPMLLKQSYEEDLSDVLYQHRVVRNGNVNLYRVVRNLGKLAYVPPASCPEDIRGASVEELAAVVEAMGATDAYEYLVADLGNGISDPLPLLRMCRKVYVPVKEDLASQAKIEAWMDYVRDSGNGDILRKMKKLVLPRYASLEGGCFDYRNLRHSPFGKYVERLIQEEDDGSEKRYVF